jgi:hypothetical protein
MAKLAMQRHKCLAEKTSLTATRLERISETLDSQHLEYFSEQEGKEHVLN